MNVKFFNELFLRILNHNGLVMLSFSQTKSVEKCRGFEVMAQPWRLQIIYSRRLMHKDFLLSTWLFNYVRSFRLSRKIHCYKVSDFLLSIDAVVCNRSPWFYITTSPALFFTDTLAKWNLQLPNYYVYIHYIYLHSYRKYKWKWK